jgi:hypothetical protein
MKFLKYFSTAMLLVAFATVVAYGAPAEELAAEECAEAAAAVGWLPLAAAFLAIPSATMASLRRRNKK